MIATASRMLVVPPIRPAATKNYFFFAAGFFAFLVVFFAAFFAGLRIAVLANLDSPLHAEPNRLKRIVVQVAS
jgi:hypothetical protein